MKTPVWNDIILTHDVGASAAAPSGGVLCCMIAEKRASERNGVFGMAKISVEIEGSADEVIGVLRRLVNTSERATAGDADRSTEQPAAGGSETTPAAEAQKMAVSHETPPGEWTEMLARDFLSSLQPAARRMALHVWRAGAAGIHRRALCQRAELTPMELRSLSMRMGRALARLQREWGMILSRPMAVNSPLQSYFIDSEFAAVATARMFGGGMPDRLADGAGCA